MATNRSQAVAQESAPAGTHPDKLFPGNWLRVNWHRGRRLGVLGVLIVREGSEAVMTVDGRYVETVKPGGQFLGRYSPLRKIEYFVVDTRDRHLHVEVTNELTILHPTPMQLDKLSVNVSYRVVDPQKVALDHASPLGMLYDYVLTAMRHAVEQLQYEDFLTGGVAPNAMLQDLRAQNIEPYLGIQVLNVQIENIVGDERANALNMNRGFLSEEERARIEAENLRQTAVREWELQRAITDGNIAKVAELTPALVAQRYPQLYVQVHGDRSMRDQAITEMLARLAQVGAVDVTPILNQLGVAGSDPRGGPPPILPGGGGASFGAAAALPTGGAARWEPGMPLEARMQEESRRIAAAFGVTPHLIEDNDGHVVQVDIPNLQRRIEVIFFCPAGFPAAAPETTIVVDGRDEEYRGQLLNVWSPDHSLVEIVHDVVRFYG